jgi:hypothetical protein
MPEEKLEPDFEFDEREQAILNSIDEHSPGHAYEGDPKTLDPNNAEYDFASKASTVNNRLDMLERRQLKNEDYLKNFAGVAMDKMNSRYSTFIEELKFEELRNKTVEKLTTLKKYLPQKPVDEEE